MQKTADEIVYDLRAFSESYAKARNVPFEKVLEYIASIGGVALFAEGLVGPVEFRDKVQRFCNTYAFDQLAPEQQALEREHAKAYNTFTRRAFLDKAEPFLRSHGVLRVDFEEVICKALRIPGICWLHKFKGSLDTAVDQLIRYLQKERPIMPKKTPQQLMGHVAKRRGEMVPFCQPRLQDLGIYDKPDESEQFYRKCWSMNWAQAMDSDIPIEELQTMFEARYQQAKESVDLTAYLSNKARPPAGINGSADRRSDNSATNTHIGMKNPEPSAEDGLFDANLAKSAEALAKLPGVDFKGDPIKPPPEEQAAPPQGDRPSAGDAIPEISATPLPAPVDEKAAVKTELTSSQTPGPEVKTEPPAEKEADQLYVKLDFVLDDTLQYDLEARWSKETDDVWIARAVCKGSEPDERTRPLLIKDIDTYLRAKKAVEVVLDIEYEPTVEQINAVKNRCYELVTKTYPGMSQDERLQKIKESWGGKIAHDAIAVWGTQGAYDKVHEALAQLQIEPEGQVKPAANLTILPSAPMQPVPGNGGVQLPTSDLSVGGTTFQLPTPTDLAFIDWYAEVSIASQMYPGIANAAQAKMVMIRGHFMGVDPAASMDSIYPIKNNKTGAYAFTVAAPLAKALVERTKECDKFQVYGDDKKATAIIKRRGREEQVFTFTIEDAKKRNLTSKWNWTAAPEVMLQYRAMTKGIKIEFPEIYYFFPEIDEEEAVA